MNMKQNLVRAIVTLCIISATVTSKAQDILVDGIYYDIISEKKTELWKFHLPTPIAYTKATLLSRQNSYTKD